MISRMESPDPLGWKDNKGIINSQKYWLEQSLAVDSVTRIDIDEDRGYIVQRFLESEFDYDAFYGEHEGIPDYEKTEPKKDPIPKKVDSSLDEWL